MLHGVSRNWWLIFAAVVLILAATPVLSACGGDDDDDGGGGGDDGGGAKEIVYHIGNCTTVFGSPGEQDQSMPWAIDQINTAGGVTLSDGTVVKFKHYQTDDMKTAAGAIKAAQQLIYDYDCGFVESMLFVGDEVAKPYFNEENVLTLAWDPPETWLGPDFPYCFHTYRDTQLSKLISLDWVQKNRPDLKNIEIIELNQERFMTTAGVETKIAEEEWGLDIHFTWYDWSTKDFYPVLTAALKDKPDALMIPQSTGAAIMPQARELGFEGQFILPEMIPTFWGDLLNADDLEGLISQTPVDDNPAVPEAWKVYRDGYAAKFGTTPYANKVFCEYLTPYLAAAAIKAADSTDRDKMKEVMETQQLTLEFPGGPMTIKFSGKEFFGVDHNWNPDVYIAVNENGKLVQKETMDTIEQYYYVGLIQKWEGQAGDIDSTVIGPDEGGGCPEDRQLSVDDTIGALLDCPDTHAILQKYIPDNISDPRLPTFITLRSLYSMAGPERMDQSTLPLIEEEINALYGE